MKKTLRNPFAAAATLAALSATLLTDAHAQNSTWDGGGASDNFSDGLNWVNDTPVTGMGIWTFAGTTRLTPVNTVAFNSLSDGSFVFDATAGAFNITGSTMRMGGITNNSSNLQTIGTGLRLNGTRTINTGAAGVRLTNSLTSTGTARTANKTGSGDLELAFTGTTTQVGFAVAAGRLVLANASGTLTLPNGVSNGSGLGAVAKTGGGVGIIAGTISYSGGTTVQAGELRYTGNYTLAGTTSLSLSGAAAPAAGTDHGFITAAGTSVLNFGGDLSLNFSGTAVDGATYNLFNIADTASFGPASFANVFITGDYAGTFANNAGIWTATAGGFGFSFSESTGDLTVSAIPEPAALAGIAGLAALGAAWIRRRRG